MSKRRSKYLVFFVGVLVVSVGLLAIGIYQLSNRLVADLCSTDIQHIQPAPGGRIALVSYVVDCGATTAFSTQASVMPVGVKFRREAYPHFFAAKGKHNLSVLWIDEKNIEVFVPHDAQIYVREPIASGVAVRYKE